MAFKEESLQYHLHLLREIYSPNSSYPSREYATNTLQEVEKALDEPTKLALGVHLLSLETEGLAVRAYGSSMIQRCVRQGVIRMEDVPVYDIYRWYSSEVTSRILRKAVIDLMVEVVLNSSPEVLVKLLDIIFCFISEKYEEIRIEKQMDAIGNIIRAILDPSASRARLRSLPPLQNTIQSQVEIVLGLVLHLLGWLHNKERGSSFLSSEERGILESSVEILGYLAPMASEPEWTRLSLEPAMRSLLLWAPARRAMVHTYKTVILSLVGKDTSPAMQNIEVTLFKTVSELCKCCTSATAEDLNFIEGVLELMEEMKSARMQVHFESFLDAALRIFQIPSLCFASRVCNILRLIDRNAMSDVPFFPFCDAIFLFCQKNTFDPVNGTHELGRMLSCEQLSSADIYSCWFGDLRGAATVLLARISELQPQLSNSYILHRITELPSPEGAAEDPRTTFGFVTQQSKTFVQWDAASWVISHLCKSLELCEDNVAAAFSALMSRNVGDAVLRPCFLEIMASFWKPKIAEKCVPDLWERTLGVLLTDLKNTAAQSSDIDVSSARRRVALLLKRASTFSQYFIPLLPAIVATLLAELVRAEGTEQSVLYEACSSFSAAQVKYEGGESAVLAAADPLIEEAHRIVFSVGSTQEAFDALVTAGTEGSLRTIRRLTDAFGTLATHFRSDDDSTFQANLGLRVCPLARCMMNRLHGMNQESYPAPYNSILSLRSHDVENLLSLQGKRSFVPDKMMDKISSALTALRYGVYQLSGLLSRFVSESELMGICAGLTDWLPRGSLHFMKTLLNLVIIPFVDAKDELVEPILFFMNKFFEMNLVVPFEDENLTPEQQEMVKEKLLRSVAKGVETQIIEKSFLEGERWKKVPFSTISGICDVLLAIGKSVDTNFSLSLLKRFLDLSASDVDASALHAIHCSAFQRIVQLIFSVPENKIGKKRLSFFGYTAGEFVVAHFDSASAILSNIGVENDAIRSLYGKLLLTRKLHAKISVCKDFFLELKRCYENGVLGQEEAKAS